MHPPSNSVDFAGDEIRFEFSERVDRASLERALTIVPELGSPPEFDWDGRDLNLRFTDTLRDATTYVFTIDNSLKDERGVAISAPIVRAVATGSVIDSGVITGKLLDARSGMPVPNMDVFALPADTLHDAAVRYRTQTDPDGIFTLSFLPQAPFLVQAFEDRNRNRSVDAGERYAVSPTPHLVPAASDSLARPLTWWVVSPDTVAPSITAIRALSSRRIELRFSESVRLDTVNPNAWTVRDTLSGAVTVADGVFLNPSDRRRIVILTDSLPSSAYRFADVPTVRDSVGNVAEPASMPFDVAAVGDTTRLRFLNFEPSERAGPALLTVRGRPGIRLNQYVRPDAVGRIVNAADTSGVPWSFEPSTDDGVTWRLTFAPPLGPGQTVVLSIDEDVPSADSIRTAQFRKLRTDETGVLLGHVESVDSVLVVEVYKEEGRQARLETTVSSGTDYRIDHLETGSYRLRMVSDRDADGMWDWGSIDPYRMPERLMWYPDSARVRAGWETVLDTLRFGL